MSEGERERERVCVCVCVTDRGTDAWTDRRTERRADIPTVTSRQGGARKKQKDREGEAQSALVVSERAHACAC